MDNKKYLIVPDVHGRDFWRDPVKKVLKYTDSKIIFLGDYVDPYINDFYHSNYGFTNDNVKCWDDLFKQVIKTLNDIIELKKEYNDRIILLLGNHDCSYAIGPNICNCRREGRYNARIIEDLFSENKLLFQLAHEDYINNKHYIFSHAGINKTYAYNCFGNDVNEENVVTLFNDAYQNDNYGILDSLGTVSHYRGGWRSNYGSLVWADIREWNDVNSYGFSIVGHTQLTEHKIEDNFAFLDCKECFTIDEKGNIEKFK